MNAQKQIKPQRFRVLRRSFVVLIGIVLALFLVATFLLATGASAPDWVRQKFESRLNLAYPSGRIHIGDIRVVPFRFGIHPTIIIKNVELRDPGGRLRIALPQVEGQFSALDMVMGQVRPVFVSVNQASLHLVRDQEGKFDISVGDGDKISDENTSLKTDAPNLVTSIDSGSLANALSGIEDLLEIPILSKLRRLESTEMRVSLDDALTGRAWKVRDGVFAFENEPDSLASSLAFKLGDPSAIPAGQASDVGFSWRRDKATGTSGFLAKFQEIRTEDIADQVVAFDWLRVLDAPISGSMSLDVAADGTLGQMHGVLDVGTGIVRQTKATKPVEFTGAKAYLSYDQTLEKFTFDEVSLNTDAAQIVANGHIYLSDRIDRTVGALIAQLRFTKVLLNPEGVFVAPVEFDIGAVDMRIQLAPFVVDIGQMVLVDGETRFTAKGRAGVKPEGWETSVDMSINTLSNARLLDLWPLVYKNNTRTWLETNVLSGIFQNVTGALRGQPGEKPKLTVGFDLRDVSVKFMKTLPPIVNGLGYGVLGGGTLDLVLERGTLTAPDGGEVNLAGTVFQILDTKIKKAPAKVSLKTQSSITSLLSVLDLKPFEFLSKAGLDTDLSKGAIATFGTIEFPLVKKVKFDQVTFAIEGKATNASSAKLVPGKTLTAKELKVVADNTGLTIAGQARLGRLPVSGLWRQDFGPENKGKSRVEGQIEISPLFLDEFKISLPKGSVKGRGTGHIEINLVRSKAPEFRLVSDLNRLQLAIVALGWSKPKNLKGRLEVRGTFGSPPKISSISIKTKGLEAKGSIKLKKNGHLDVARFDTLDLDGWMKTPVEIRTDANGNAAFTLVGGTVDFRKSQFGSDGSENGKGNRINARLDRLILSSGISLTDVQGDMNTAGGVTGSFSGRVNGGARIVGTLAPYNGGTGVRFTSNDAGAVMRSAGIFESAVGGRMDMILVPAGKRGHYNGSLEATHTRVVNASALADLLSAISVVGLLEQLGGEGIAFSDVDARFRLTPTGVNLQESSAIGASLGLTMQGAYDFSASTMDMQGVITPIYLLNGILEQTKIFGGLFGKQKGEGLFGFNYTLKGRTDAPKVGVNPLSILTPGMFREIFRRPVPEQADQ